MLETINELAFLSAKALSLLEVLHAWCESKDLGTAQITIEEISKIVNEINLKLDKLV